MEGAGATSGTRTTGGTSTTGGTDTFAEAATNTSPQFSQNAASSRLSNEQ
ncbi:MAG: hypothetical protein ACLUE1_09130 [Adlercreutzia equolifaciens]